MGVVQNRWPTNAPIFSQRLHEHRTTTADSNRPSCLSDGWTRAAAGGTNFLGQFFWLEKYMGMKYGKKSDQICLANNEDAKIDFIGVIEDFIDCTELCL